MQSRMPFHKSGEYRCPLCRGIAQGTVAARFYMDKAQPDEVRQSLREYPYEFKIEAWRNGKGLNLTIFPDAFEKHQKALNGESGPSAVVLFCRDCHSRSEYVGGETPCRYWEISTRHGLVWAWNRSHLILIRDHIQSEHRERESSLFKLPSWILSSKNREEIVKLINRAIENGVP